MGYLALCKKRVRGEIGKRKVEETVVDLKSSFCNSVRKDRARINLL